MYKLTELARNNFQDVKAAEHAQDISVLSRSKLVYGKFISVNIVEVSSLSG